MFLEFHARFSPRLRQLIDSFLQLKLIDEFNLRSLTQDYSRVLGWEVILKQDALLVKGLTTDDLREGVLCNVVLFAQQL